MTTTFSQYFRFGIPDFLSEPWHTTWQQTVRDIDAALYSAVLAQNMTVWQNAHVYVITDIVISPQDGSIWVCSVAHTSAIAPITFSADRLAHPTFWTEISVVSATETAAGIARLATQAEAEAGVNDTTIMTPLKMQEARTYWNARRTPYVGQVATRTFIPRVFDTVSKQAMTRTRHRASDNISSLQIIVPNYYINTAALYVETGTGTATSVTAAIEYPVGTFTQIKFAGIATGNVLSGQSLISDSVNVEIPDGGFFYVRMFWTNITGTIYEDFGSDDNNGEALTIAASGLADQTLGGTVIQTNANFRFAPTAIVGKTAKPTLYLLGASSNYGVGDAFIDASGDIGVVARSIGGAAGYGIGSIRGDCVNFFVNGANAQRVALAVYFTHINCDLGRNDIANLTRSAAQVMADLQTLFALFPHKPITVNTCLPTSTTTDGWTTLTSQTTSVTNAQRILFNNLLRALPAPIVDCFELADIIESVRDSGKWKPGYTNDGVHPSISGHLAIRDSGIVNPAVVTNAPPAIKPPQTQVPSRQDNVVMNGGMTVSQELVTTGASLASTVAKYILDGFGAQYTHGAGTAVITSAQVAAASFPIALPGFTFGHQLKATTALSAPANGDFAKHKTIIEGYRVAHLGFGASGASYLRYAFMFYTTVTGVIFIKFSNFDQSRCYYVEIVVIAGWNFVSGSIPGDISGTWKKDTNEGLTFEIFSAGKSAAPIAPNAWTVTNTTQTTNSGNLLGTNNNLTILTGLWIAAGTQLPTQNDLISLLRSFTEEEHEAKRYYFKTFEYATLPAQNVGINTGECQFPALVAGAIFQRNFAQILPRRMRVAPTPITYNPAAANAQVRDSSAVADCSATTVGTAAGTSQFRIGQTNNAATVIGNLLAVHFTLDARFTL